MRTFLLGFVTVALAVLGISTRAAAQERPYFITYNHQLEEPDHLEISVNPVFAIQRGGNDFLAHWVEFEYGATGWWTTEFYLEGQSTISDSTLFTGFRWENRIRPLLREHWINPVLYVEYEDLNGGDKTMIEVVGFDGQADHAVLNSAARREHARESESKLILSSNFKGWNISENFIAEKNIAHRPWEFGYAVGASRPLALAASPRECRFCPENFSAGIEFYGGLGTAKRLTLSGTSHYAAPVLNWSLPNNVTMRVSPGWGLTGTSHHFLLRWGVSYEIAGFVRRLRNLF